MTFCQTCESIVYDYEERAAIMEYEGSAPRHIAEQKAAHWLRVALKKATCKNCDIGSVIKGAFYGL